MSYLNLLKTKISDNFWKYQLNLIPKRYKPVIGECYSIQDSKILEFLWLCSDLETVLEKGIPDPWYKMDAHMSLSLSVMNAWKEKDFVHPIHPSHKGALLVLDIKFINNKKHANDYIIKVLYNSSSTDTIIGWMYLLDFVWIARRLSA